MHRRAKMSPADRAKQFMPFAALKGFEKALREREKIRVPKIILSEERRNELDIICQQIHRGTIITVIYFCNEEYLKISGLVARFDTIDRILQVVNTQISFDDILDIEIVGCLTNSDRL